MQDGLLVLGDLGIESLDAFLVLGDHRIGALELALHFIQGVLLALHAVLALLELLPVALDHRGVALELVLVLALAGEVVVVLGLKDAHTLASGRDRRLGLVDRVLDLVGAGVEGPDALLGLLYSRTVAVHVSRQARKLALMAGPLLAPDLLEVGEGLDLEGLELDVELQLLLDEVVVANGLLRLVLQRVVGAPLAGEDVLDLYDVLVRPVYLALGLVALDLEAGDACRLLEDVAPVLRLAGEDLVDLALLEDRVGALADSRIEEELADVLQKTALAVDVVLVALSRAEGATLDLDLGKVGLELVLAVVDRQGDLGVLHGLAAVGAVEDDVLHLAGAQRLRRLLAQDPFDRVDDVRLAAAVRSKKAGDAVREVDVRLVGEAFESVDVEALEEHSAVLISLGLTADVCRI